MRWQTISYLDLHCLPSSFDFSKLTELWWNFLWNFADINILLSAFCCFKAFKNGPTYKKVHKLACTNYEESYQAVRSINLHIWSGLFKIHMYVNKALHFQMHCIKKHRHILLEKKLRSFCSAVQNLTFFPAKHILTFNNLSITSNLTLTCHYMSSTSIWLVNQDLLWC